MIATTRHPSFRSPRPPAALPAGPQAVLCALLAALLLALGACAPTEGVSTAFVPVATTNFDFTITSILVGDNPRDIAVADYNNDGKPDIAVANHFSSSVTVLTNNGGGDFTTLAPKEIAVAGYPSRILWFNLDGNPAHLSLAVIIDVGTTHQLVIVKNDGTGGFAVNKSYDFGTVVNQMVPFCKATTACSTALAQDLIASVSATKVMAVFTNADLANTAATTLTPTTTATADGSTSYAPTRFVVGAIDGGMVPDVAVLLPSVSKLLPLIGDGNGSFAAGTLVGVPATPHAIAGGNLVRASGALDFAVTSPAANVVTIVSNDGTGALTAQPGIAITAAAEAFVAPLGGAYGDVLVSGSDQEAVTYIKSAADGTFTATGHYTTRNTIAFATGDYSGTTAKDFVTAEFSKRAVGVFQGDGAGGFTRTQIGFESLVNHPTTVPNLCGGGKDDLIALQPNVDQVLVLCSAN